MILLKRLYIMNWLSKSVILILKESNKRLVSKRTIRFRKKITKQWLKMLMKKYLIPVNLLTPKILIN